jgi:tungstate transport system ATP-binding protein
MSVACAYNIRSLKHAYGEKVALDIPHLDVPPGQALGLVGPNGSGKTTLLAILALLLTPVSGSVLLRGGESTGSRKRWKLRRQVTLIHQKPVLFSTTVRHNVSYGLRVLGLPARDIETRVGVILDELGLTSAAEKQAQELSGGEAQRVVLARGLVLETPIVLLDEPTHSLDSTFRPVLLELLRKANQSRRATIIVATHDFEFLSSLADRIIRLEGGSIASCDRPDPRRGCEL